MRLGFSQEPRFNEIIKQGIWRGENIEYWTRDVRIKIIPNVDLQAARNYLTTEVRKMLLLR